VSPLSDSAAPAPSSPWAAPAAVPARVVGRAVGGLAATGSLFAIGLEALRRTWDVRDWFWEFIDQSWFLARVTMLPALMVAVPLGAPGPPVFGSQTTAKLKHTLSVLGSPTSGLGSFADSITSKQQGGNFIRIKPVFSLPGALPPAERYPQPTPAPVLPPLYECVGDGRKAAAASTLRPYATPAPGSQATTTGKAQGPFITTDPRGAATPSTPSPWSRWLPLLPVLAASIILAHAALRLGVTVRRNRRLS
jgi:hypothetical protein